MSLLNLSNYKSNRFNPYYLKLLPVASLERPPQAKELEDIQDIIINPINKYTLYNFNDYEILSGLEVIQTTSNSITINGGNILLNNYPVIIRTEQETITNSTPFILYIAINIIKDNNKYISSYKFNTENGYPLIQVNSTNYKYLYKSKSTNIVRQALCEIYGNFVAQGLVYANNCVSPGIAYINGNRINFPYHTAITSTINDYRIIIRDNYITTVPPNIKLDLNNELDLGLYINNKWQPNLSIKQIKNKDISLLESNLNKLRDYLLETALLQPIDTTSNLITDSFNNTNNADTSNLLFDCDIEQGNLILNKFSRVTNNVVINNINTNTKIINDKPNVIIQDYTTTALLSQTTSDTFLTIGKSNKGILKLGPTKLDTSIYQRTSDKTVLLTQSIINAEAYGLTANSSDFRLTVGSKLITVQITTNDQGYAAFSFTLPQGVNTNDVITIENNTSSATSSLYNTSYPIDTSYVGQVITIDKDDTTLVGGSIYIRKVNATNPVIKVLLTKFTDKPQEVIAQVIINNNQITTSVSGSLSTKFDWETPITLSKGTYSLIISSINSPIDIFISNSSTLSNSYLFSSDSNQSGITTYLNQDLAFELFTGIYSRASIQNSITITDSIDKFDHLFYPGRFKIGGIEYTNEAAINLTNSIDITLDINKYIYVYPVLISTNKSKSTYISKTIRTNFHYNNIYLEMDAIILDTTSVRVYISSNEGYSYEEIVNPIKYLIDGNDQTYKYVYTSDLSELTSIINKEGSITQATRNYLTIRIDLATESNNKPTVKGYKAYVR